MFQVGDLVYWHDDPNLVGYVLWSDDEESSIDWRGIGVQKKKNKYLKRFGASATQAPVSKPTWKDDSDTSRIENVRPGIHAACFYEDDGACWGWLVTTKATGADIVGQGKSIDRRTAKSDAEFFIANYQPEDTSERDEIRKKLERSWYGS